MSWLTQLRSDSLPWLLEAVDPGVRYLALRDLLALPADDTELAAAQRAAHVAGPIATVLDAMEGDGYWAEPGPGYLPKYRSTVWSIIFSPSWARRWPSTNALAAPAPMCSIMPSPSVGTSRPQARLPARQTACRATCAGRCLPLAATIRGSMPPSIGWRERHG